MAAGEQPLYRIQNVDDEHMKLGFDCLREVMVAGYKLHLSASRLYDAQMRSSTSNPGWKKAARQS